MDNIEQVKQIGSRIIEMMGQEYGEARPDIGLMAILEAGVQMVQVFNPGMSTADACDEMIRVLSEIRTAERGGTPGPMGG